MPFYIQYAQGGRGLMHGGALVSLADTAVVMAIKSLIPPHSHFATIAAEVRYLLPVKKGVITRQGQGNGAGGKDRERPAPLSTTKKSGAVMEFLSTFKIARDTAIRGHHLQGRRRERRLLRPHGPAMSLPLRHPGEGRRPENRMDPGFRLSPE